MKGRIVSPTLFPLPCKHLGSTMGLIWFQPGVTTQPLNLTGGIEHFYEILFNKKKLTKAVINIHIPEKNCLNSQTIFTGMNTYGFWILKTNETVPNRRGRELIGVARLVYFLTSYQLILEKGLLLKCLTSLPVSMISFSMTSFIKSNLNPNLSLSRCLL